MPAVRVYTVTQEREVKVRAESPADAVRLGDLAFRGQAEVSGDSPSIVSSEKTISIGAREDY